MKTAVALAKERPLTTGWTTEDEIAYVKKIGQHAPGAGEYLGGRPAHPPREEMLQRYIAAAQSRFDWGGMDARKVLAVASYELAKVRLKSAKKS